MLDSSNIQIKLNCDYFKQKDDFSVRKKIIYTGPIDRYFSFIYGELEWRSIELQKHYVDVKDFQGTSVMNYADLDIEYTRCHEYKHLHPEREYIKDKTVVFYENPVSNDKEPYYPINTNENLEFLKKYKELAKKEKNVIIGGRLGDYAYYDMDVTISAALKCYKNEILPS